MECKVKKLKADTINSHNVNLKFKRKPLRNALKSGAQIKKERKKLSKIKTEEKVPCKKNLEGQSSSRKRKLQDEPEEKLGKKLCKTKDFSFKWTDEEYLAQLESINITTARNIIELLSNDNTIPFIARYRGDLTGDLTPDKLRKIKTSYEYIQSLHVKAEKLIQLASSSETLSSDLILYLQTARTLDELEFLGSSFKKGSKRSLAARAKELGLENVAKLILEGKDTVKLEDFVNPTVSGLSTLKNVKLGIQHIIADIISKDAEVHSLLEKIYSSKEVVLNCKFKEEKSKEEKASSKYHLYGDFSQPLNTIRPHQTLAINRGESENELTVKIVIPDFLWLPLKTFCHKKWLKSGSNCELRHRLFSDSVDDAVKRLLGPLAVRRMRSKLNAEAENEALSVFGINLRQLLMTPPCSGRVVMGIDPGFANGCKVAVVSHTGNLLSHDKFFLRDRAEARKKLRSLVLANNCETIALGNGTACRETETLLSEFITRGIFRPLNVSYTIVNEQGVSIYSCSSVAAEEFPSMDPKIVSAISLARRLQNPLSELVKVEPKHLGVGMYQHDVGEKILISTLDDVVSECVSFVGVDVNSASLHLLKRVAGLGACKAQEIIKYRSEIGPFKCRDDLKNVKGIKTKTFLQCAGFLRVIPSTAITEKHTFDQKEFNPLDETCIHPESYDAAYKIINRFGLSLNRLGSDDFVDIVKKKKETVVLDELAKYCECSVVVVEFIIDALMKPKDFDLRTLSPGPIFRKGIKNLEDLFPGQILEGIVRNVVTFGAFVDVGVGSNGLIHVSQIGKNSVQLNNRVNVEVMSVNLFPPRIELKMLSVIK